MDILSGAKREFKQFLLGSMRTDSALQTERSYNRTSSSSVSSYSNTPLFRICLFVLDSTGFSESAINYRHEGVQWISTGLSCTHTSLPEVLYKDTSSLYLALLPSEMPLSHVPCLLQQFS